MLTHSPALRSSGARILFLLAAAVTVALLLWMHQLRLHGPVRGLTPIFWVLFAWEDYGSTVVALLILMAAVLIPGLSGARRALRWAGEHPVAIAAASLVVMCVGALVVYHNHPLSMDEYAPYFQSQAFAAGHLNGQLPLPLMDWLIPPGFQEYFFHVGHSTGRVASNYWPGFALLLTPFTWAGIPWACNPVISAATLLVIHRLALNLFEDTEAAGLAVLLTVASPVFFGMGISYYSMPAHLLANSLYALLLIHPTPRRALLAGLIGSLALALHNPVPHMLFAVPWFIWIATRQGGLRLLACLCAGYLPLGVLLGIGWFQFSNQLITEGRAAAQASGFAASRLNEMLAIFTAPDGSVVLARAIALAKIWVWAVPTLVLLACVGAWRWRHDPLCRLLTASALLTFGFYLFVPVDQGHGWGYRYFHSAWLALPLLGAAALTRARGAQTPARIFQDEGTQSFVAVCVLLTLVVGIGYRAVEMNEFIADDLTQMPAYTGTERRVVIIDTRFTFYGPDLVQNDPLLRGNVIRMISHGFAVDAAMMRVHFPGLNQVYADRYGTVWSELPPQTARRH